MPADRMRLPYGKKVKYDNNEDIHRSIIDAATQKELIIKLKIFSKSLNTSGQRGWRNAFQLALFAGPRRRSNNL